MFNVENRNFRINVVVFSMVGFFFYIYSFHMDSTILKANPIYSEGASGIPISIVGASITYYYFRYMRFPFIRIMALSVLIFTVWIGGVMYIGSNLEGSKNATASFAWIGVLTIMYFMFIGGINGLLGVWISLFNILVISHTIFSGGSLDPIVWTSILGLIGIDNPVFLWSVVLISCLLGVSDKGYDFFINQST